MTKASFFTLHIFPQTTIPQPKVAEVGNVTSKCNGVTRYRFCLAVSAINFNPLTYILNIFFLIDLKISGQVKKICAQGCFNLFNFYFSLSY